MHVDVGLTRICSYSRPCTNVLYIDGEQRPARRAAPHYLWLTPWLTPRLRLQEAGGCRGAPNGKQRLPCSWHATQISEKQCLHVPYIKDMGQQV